MHKLLRFFTLFLSSLLLSCVGPLTEVWVVVSSNIPAMGPPSMSLEKVNVSVKVIGTDTPFWNTDYELSSGTYALPGNFVIRPRSADESRPIELIVTGVFRDGAVGREATKVTQRAVFTFTRGRRQVLNVFLASECVGQRQTECEMMGRTCGEGGQCVIVERSMLPEYGLDVVANDAVSDTPNIDGPAPTLAPPQLIRPLSGSVMTTKRPTIRWQNPLGVTQARVELFADRACTRPLDAMATNDVSGVSFTPPSPLPTGTVFFRVRSRFGTLVGEPSMVWQLRVPQTVAGTVIDNSLRTDADFNGDGLADIAYDATMSMGGARQTSIIFGRRSMADAIPTLTLPGSVNATNGPELVGDVNGDGFVDFAFSTETPSRRLVVYFGRESPSNIAGGATMIAPPPNATGRFGASIVAAGDVDQDGYGDIVLSSGADMRQTGQLWLILGARTFGTVPPVLVATGSASNLTEVTAISAGDMSGDGRAEIMFSTPLGPGMRGSQAGEVAMFGWSEIEHTIRPATVLYMMPEQPNQHMGSSLSVAGDNNGDGRADLVVNANGYTFMGSTSGGVGWKAGAEGTPTNTVPILRVGTRDTPLGQLVRQIGDVNGDGFGDVAMQQTISGASAVLIHLGSMLGLRNTEAQVITGDAMPASTVGSIVAGIGDFNGDGFDDFVCPTTAPPPAMSLRVYTGSSTFPLQQSAPAAGLILGVAASH
jgi:hypothetical protein